MRSQGNHGFSFSVSFQFFFFLGLGFELRAFTLSHSTSPVVVKGFSSQGLAELFAQAGFKPQSS
jgi:hypothetical protein